MSATRGDHQRDYYKDLIDFSTLALKDAEFARFYNAAGGTLDLQDADALRYPRICRSALDQFGELTLVGLGPLVQAKIGKERG